MAADPPFNADSTHMTEVELLAFTQKELDAERERQAQVNDESNEEVPQVSQSGATLDYSKRNIRELLASVIVLIAPVVERLALSHNPQITIPKEIVQCDRLRYLNVRANKLVEFPPNILLLSKLEILDLSKNDITIIPENIKTMASLKFLAVVRNRIKRLPLALGDMPNLSKLKFEDNPIEFPTLEELQLPEDRNALDQDRDREMCQQVKRVLKSKALRQRLLRSTTDDEGGASESNAETPRPPRRQTNGRFPVKPSISKIEGLSELTRSASNSPPEASQLTAKQTLLGTPTKQGLSLVSEIYSSANRSRSESASTTASIRARRQGFVPGKRSNELGAVNEIMDPSIRSSNASTIKAMHAYKASTSSGISGLGSSSGADTSSGPVSPISDMTGDLKLLVPHRRRIEQPPHSTRTQRSPAIYAARRLRYSLSQLYRPLHQVAYAVFKGIPKNLDVKRHLYAAGDLVEQLERTVETLDSRTLKGQLEVEVKRKITFLVHSALKSFGVVMDAVQVYVAKIGFVLNPLHTRCLMHQLYAATVEARNVVQMFDMPIKYTGVENKETPRASRISNAVSTRTITPTEARAPVVSRRMRGATILRNEISNSALRVIPPARSVDNSRSNTMTSTLNPMTPGLGDSYAPMPSAVLPSQANMRAMLNTSSDEQDDNNSEQFEGIFLKLREACDVASRVLPACLAEINQQIDNASRDQSRAARLWQRPLKSYRKVAKANADLNERLGTIRLKEAGVRHQKEFWLQCDSFVQTWAEFAIDIKQLASEAFDVTSIRSLMKPMQRIVKNLSKLISESALYHQAIRNGPGTARVLAPPFQLGLNTTQAQAFSNIGSNPSSADPNSAQSGTLFSMPATPLTAALGPAAQVTLAGTPNRSAIIDDYFASVTTLPRNAHDRPDTAIATASAIPTSAHTNGMSYSRR